MCPLFGKKNKNKTAFFKRTGWGGRRQAKGASRVFSRFPSAQELFSLSALCSSRLRILVSIWGNGSAQGTGLDHGHGPSCRRPVPASLGAPRASPR